MSNGVQQFVLDENDDGPYVVISCLNFISQIQPGYVIESETLQLYENNLVNRMWRSLKCALTIGANQREKSLIFFKRVISSAFGFIEAYLDSNDNDRVQIGALGFLALSNSVVGLENHRKTYLDKGDFGHASQMKVLIDTITFRIPLLQVKANCIYPENT